jgi:hypothetical protein
MSIRGVITSATVVPASENTPSSMSRSAGPALREPLVGILARDLASAQPASRRNGRSGASVAAAPRRAGRVSSGATAPTILGSRSPTIQTRPMAATSRMSPPVGERAHHATAAPAAAPASTSRAR